MDNIAGSGDGVPGRPWAARITLHRYCERIQSDRFFNTAESLVLMIL
jgi:hypothetical protein